MGKQGLLKLKDLESFFKKNPDFNIRHANLFRKQVLPSLELPKKVDENTLLASLRAMQRLACLTSDDVAVRKLYQQGLHSALQAGELSEAQFVDRYAAYFLGGVHAAQTFYQRALASKAQAGLSYLGIQQQTQAHYRHSRFNNFSALSDKIFSDLPSYQDLFGGLDFCHCDDCRSIFSPAAYFADLMRVMAKYIQLTPQAKEAAGAQYPMLKTRRLDLWKIALDCANTNTKIPKLTIVNEVLAEKAGIQTFEDLNTPVYPFSAPLDVPLNAVQTYLQQQEVSLATVWADLSLDPDTLNQHAVAFSRLAMSHSQEVIICQSQHDDATLASYYGLQGSVLSSLESVDTFLKVSNLDGGKLLDLLYQDLSEAEINQQLQNTFFINSGKTDAIGITDGNLTQFVLPDRVRVDHMHRFLRLANLLNWSFADVDWAMSTVDAMLDSADRLLNDDTVLYLSWMLELQSKPHLSTFFSVNWACALLGYVKNHGCKDGHSYYDAVFAVGHVLGSKVLLNATWHVPLTIDASSAADDIALQNALIATLKVSAVDLLQFANKILDVQKIMPVKKATSRPLPLSLKNLSILYRLSQLGILTQLSMDEVFVAMGLLGVTCFDNLAGWGENVWSTLQDLLQFSDWLQEENLSVYRVQYWLTGESNDKKIMNAVFHHDAVMNFSSGLRSALTAAKASQDQVIAAVKSGLQMSSVSNVESLLWLALTDVKTGFIDTVHEMVVQDPATAEALSALTTILTNNCGLDQESAASLAPVLQATLVNYQQLQAVTLYQQLAGLCNVSSDMMPALVAWVYIVMSDDQDVGYSDNSVQAVLDFIDSAWSTAVGYGVVKEKIGLGVRLRYLQQLVDFFLANKLSVAEVKSMHNPVTAPCYGIDFSLIKENNNWLTLAVLQAVSQFKTLVLQLSDRQNNLLDYFVWAMQQDKPEHAAIAEQLHALTNQPVQAITFLLDTLWPVSANSPQSSSWATVSGVALLARYFHYEALLNIDVSTVYDLFSLNKSGDSYADWDTMRVALWSGLQMHYQNTPEVLQALTSAVDQLQRDTLIDLAIYHLNQQAGAVVINNRRDLHDYLLLDVEVGPTVMTSRIVAAISSVQLYIYRCLNNLEALAHTQDEVRQWWPWLSHYRLWQANREVFIYPENYLQPELRKGKTPLFAQLENDLKQVDLSDPDSVDYVFREYINGFHDIADLVYAGAAVHADTVFFVMHSEKPPCRFFYQTATMQANGAYNYQPVAWQPRQEIMVQINAEGNSVMPLYAFGRWYLFWVSFTQTSASSTSAQPAATTPIYTAAIHYAYLNSNQSWSEAKTLVENINLPSSLKSASKYVYPMYAATLDTILVTYKPDEYDHGGVGAYIYLLNESSFASAYLSSTRAQHMDVHYFRFWRTEHQLALSYDLPSSLEKTVYQTQYLLTPQQEKVTLNYSYMNFRSDKNKLGFSPDFTLDKYSVLSFWFSFPEYALPVSLISFTSQTSNYEFYINEKNKLAVLSMQTPVIDGPALKPQVLHSLIVIVNADKEPIIYINGVQLPVPLPFSADAIVVAKLSYDIGKQQDVASTIDYQELLFWTDASEPVAGLVPTLMKNGARNVTPSSYSRIDFPKAMGVYFENKKVIGVPILNQPSWRIVQVLGERLLMLPQQEPHGSVAVTRLNSTVAARFSETLMTKGIAALLSSEIQATAELPFSMLKPVADVIPVGYRPADTVDFFNSALSEYFWEIFFFVPFLMANALQNQQQFSRAQVWYQYIFNPTVELDKQLAPADANDMYWQFLALRAANNPTLKVELTENWADEVQSDMQSFSQLCQYHNDPFDPHSIAVLRPIAYQKSVVMHYIDNTIKWADNLFRQYTRESVVEATMLYVTAYDLLGEQPRDMGPCPLPAAETLEQMLVNKGINLNQLSEFLIILENKHSNLPVTWGGDVPSNYIADAYFGLPENTQFMQYWALIKTRLYDMRHGLNIDGVAQQLALFQPAINPMQLVQTFASGRPVNQLMPNLNVDVPYYRFPVLLEKARATTQILIQFGQSLLVALERHDAEQLALLQNKQQQQILVLMEENQQAQIEAAENGLAALKVSLSAAQGRYEHYNTLISNGLIPEETAQLALDATAIALQSAAQGVRIGAFPAYLVPTIYGLADGGFSPGDAVSSAAGILEGSSAALNMSAGLAGAMANFQRRYEEWQLQLELAQYDMDRIQYAINAQEAQLSYVKENNKLQQQQIKQQQDIEHYMKNKFTSSELYQWLIGNLSTLYYQAYKLAYDLSMMAQNAWQFERCQNDKTFIAQNTYWNNIYHGLTAGESLMFDLQRMETAYLKQNQRRFEIAKIISLKTLLGADFAQSKKDGLFNFSLKEVDFDADYPGHYQRQIKTVSISLPMLLGPYQTVSAILTQTKNTVYLQPGGDEKSARIDMRANQQVALSKGLNDSGLFLLDFNDMRYLPFEGTGAESCWTLQFNKSMPNLDTLTDVIIEIKYTSLPGSMSPALMQQLSSEQVQ